MSNSTWYYYNKKDNKYELTELATDKAKKSYIEFYNLIKHKGIGD